jgi:hypothetical protein
VVEATVAHLLLLGGPMTCWICETECRQTKESRWECPECDFQYELVNWMNLLHPQAHPEEKEPEDDPDVSENTDPPPTNPLPS